MAEEQKKNLSWSQRLWQEWLRPLILVVAVMAPLRSAVADWNDVPTGSMKPTILEGDRVVVNKLAYDLKVPFTTWHLAQWDDPERGDIVVFWSPADGKRLVKRAVGIPGDKIELRDNMLVVNGAKSENEEVQYLHQGLVAPTSFERRFELADYVTVEGAKLENGLLVITLKKDVPEEMKPRRIAIRSETTKPASKQIEGDKAA